MILGENLHNMGAPIRVLWEQINNFFLFTKPGGEKKICTEM